MFTGVVSFGLEGAMIIIHILYVCFQKRAKYVEYDGESC